MLGLAHPIAWYGLDRLFQRVGAVERVLEIVQGPVPVRDSARLEKRYGRG